MTATDAAVVERAHPPSPPAREASRRRMAVFVGIFLVCALTLLVAYRLAADTIVMDRYLFEIARHTAVLLGRLGDSSSVEEPGMYAGREAEIRTLTTAWSRRPIRPAKGSLSPWEVWRFRALQARRDAALAQQRYARLVEPYEPPPVDLSSKAELLARLDRLEAVFRPDRPGHPSALADTQALARLQQLRAALAGPSPLPAGDAERTAQVRAALDAFSAQAAADAQRRALVLATEAREEGPRIHYTARKAATPAEKDVSFRFTVVPDCGALPSMAIFLAAVIAFPAGWRRKAAGALVGIPLLYAVNIVRLACLGILGAWYGSGEWFDFAHNYVWQGLYIVVVVAFWLLWVEWVVRRPRLPKAPPP